MLTKREPPRRNGAQAALLEELITPCLVDDKPDNRKTLWPAELVARGPYGALLVDPPWNFRTWSLKGDGKAPPYPRMSITEIAAMPIGDLARNVPQLITAPRREHSRKPDETRLSIERLVAGPYCELFARECASGWSSWGNQVDHFPRIPANGVDALMRASDQLRANPQTSEYDQ